MVLFSCNVKELKTAVSKAGSLLNKRATGEVLKSVAVELAGDSIYIKATDLQSFAVFKVPAEISGAGKFLLEAKQFLQALKSLKGKVKAKFKDSLTLELSDERQVFYVKVSDYSYPEFPVIPSLTLYPINANILVKAIDKVVYILDKSDRTNLNYMLIKGLEGKTDFVATDGYRLALYSPSIIFTGEVKIYKDVIKVLKTFIKDVKGDVMIGVINDYLYVKADNWELITANSNMIYPNYQYLISSYDKVEFNEFYIDKEMYINSLKFLKTSIEKDEVFALKLSITSDKAVFEIVENGEGRAELPVKDFKGNPVVIGINGDFLLEALSGFDTDLIKVKVSNTERPVFLESIDKDKDPYMCLVMPRTL